MSSFDQQDLDNLSRELRGFTEGMREFTSKGGFTGGGNNIGANPSNDASNQPEKISANFDKSTQKIVNALALLSVSLTKTNSSEKEKTKGFVEFNKIVKKSTDAQEKFYNTTVKNKANAEAAAATAKANQEAEDERIRLQNRTTRQVINENLGVASKKIKDFGSQWKSNALEMIRGQKEPLEGLGGVVSRINDVFTKSVVGVSRFSSTVANSSDDVGSLTNVMGALGKVVGGLVGLIPVIGSGLTKLSEGATEVSKIMLEQFAASMRTFKQLTEVGLVSSFEDMDDASKKMSLTFEDINQALGKYSTSIAKFDGGMIGGMKVVKSLAQEMSPLREQFRLLGINAAEFAEYQAKYLVQEGKLGLLKDRDSKNLSRSTAQYIEELTVMSMLTGESRKALQDKADARRAESQYSSFRQVNKNDQEMLAMMESYMSMAGTFLGEEVGKGARANIGGQPVGPDGTNLYHQTGGEIVEILQLLQTKQIDQFEALARTQKAIDRTAKMMGTAEHTAKYGATQGVFSEGKLSERQEGANAILPKNAKEAEAKMAKNKEDAKNKDSLNATAAAAEEELYKAKLKMKDALMNPAGLNAVIGTTTATLKLFNKGLDEVIKRFGGPPKTKTEIVKESAKESLTAAVPSTGFAGALFHSATGGKYLDNGKGKITSVSGTTGEAPKSGAPSISPSGNMSDYLKKIAVIESSGKSNARAKTTSASGLFQFTEDTWKDTVTNMRKNYSLNDRFDPVKSAEVAEYFTRKQKEQLEKGTKRSANDVDMYMAHFLGAGGATKFLNAMNKNPDAPSSEGASAAQIKANPSIFLDRDRQIRSLQEVYDLMSMKIRGAESQISSGKVTDDVKAIGASSTAMKTPEPATPEARTGGIFKGPSTDKNMADQPAKQEARTGGIFKGPSTGYTVELHGDEAVVPMNEGVSKQALNTSVFNQDNSSIDKMVAMFETMQYKYDQMIDLMSRQADNGDKLVQAAY